MRHYERTITKRTVQLSGTSLGLLGRIALCLLVFASACATNPALVDSGRVPMTPTFVDGDLLTEVALNKIQRISFLDVVCRMQPPEYGELSRCAFESDGRLRVHFGTLSWRTIRVKRGELLIKTVYSLEVFRPRESTPRTALHTSASTL
jgi:hypothetical protein